MITATRPRPANARGCLAPGDLPGVHRRVPGPARDTDPVTDTGALQRARSMRCASEYPGGNPKPGGGGTLRDLLWPDDGSGMPRQPDAAAADACAQARLAPAPGPASPPTPWRRRSAAMQGAPDHVDAAYAVAAAVAAAPLAPAGAPPRAWPCGGFACATMAAIGFARRDAAGEIRDGQCAIDALNAAGESRTPCYAEALLVRVDGHRRLGELTGAERQLDEAQRVLEGIGHARGTVMTEVLNQRTLIAIEQGRHEQAARWARAEIALDEALAGAGSTDGLEARGSLIRALQLAGRLDQALAAYGQAQAIVERAPASLLEDDPQAAYGIPQSGALVFLDLRGCRQVRLELVSRAIDLVHAHFPPPAGSRLLVLLLDRSLCERALGRLLDSRATLEQALAMERQSTPVWIERRIRCVVALAELQLEMGDREAAVASARAAALASDTPVLSYWKGRASRVLAAAAAARRAGPEADAEAVRAMDLLAPRLGPDHALVLELRALRCVAQLGARSGGDACETLARRMGAGVASRSPVAQFAILDALADHAEAAGQAKLARDFRIRALAAAAGSDGPAPLWAALDHLAMHLRLHPVAERDRTMAVFLEREAVLLLEALRDQFTGSGADIDRRFVADKADVYRRLAGWLCQDGWIDDALETLHGLEREKFAEFVGGDLPLRRPRRRVGPGPSPSGATRACSKAGRNCAPRCASRAPRSSSAATCANPPRQKRRCRPPAVRPPPRRTSARGRHACARSSTTRRSRSARQRRRRRPRGGRAAARHAGGLVRPGVGRGLRGAAGRPPPRARAAAAAGARAGCAGRPPDARPGRSRARRRPARAALSRDRSAHRCAGRRGAGAHSDAASRWRAALPAVRGPVRRPRLSR